MVPMNAPQTNAPPPPLDQHAMGGLQNAFAQMDNEQGRNTSVTKQQRWLLFLRHCAKCRQSEEDCSLKTQCKFGKQLWHHILHCANGDCEFPRCTNSKDLLKHHQKCQDVTCQICVPVKDYVRRTRQQQGAQSSNPMMAQQQQQQQPSYPQNHMVMPGMIPNPPTMMIHNPGMNPGMNMGVGMIPNPPSRMGPNSSNPNMMPQQQQQMMMQQMMMGGAPMLNSNPNATYNHHKRPLQTSAPMGFGGFTTSGPMGVSGGFIGGMVPGLQPLEDFRPQPKRQRTQSQPIQAGGLMMNAARIYPGQGMIGPGIPAAVVGAPSSHFHRNGRSPSFFGKDIYHRNTGTSLLETFTLEQLEMHLSLTYEAATPLRQAQVNRPHNPQEDTLCMVCEVTKLTFEPATLYCSTCGNKIKRSQTYYTVPPTHDTAESRVSHPPPPPRLHHMIILTLAHPIGQLVPLVLL